MLICQECGTSQSDLLQDALTFECYCCGHFNDLHDTQNVRSYNVGESDYAKHKIQPWDIWLEYNLNPWDADIIKRVLRTKNTDSRKLDYEKIIHICQERIRQINTQAQKEPK